MGFFSIASDLWLPLMSAPVVCGYHKSATAVTLVRKVRKNHTVTRFLSSACVPEIVMIILQLQ